MKAVNLYDLPENPDAETVYHLEPKNEDEEYYLERTCRNIGWITPEEQNRLRHTSIGVAGCGGMGAQLAEKFVRLGIGEIRIADVENFDVSNINRQFAAMRSTVGKNKAFETARMLRAVSDDFRLSIYPQGICPEVVSDFLYDLGVVCDEIDFWAVAARILLHQKARRKNIPIFNCNTIGFGTRLFLFTAKSATMEECLGFSYEEAADLQKKIHSKTASEEEVNLVMEKVYGGLFPELPEYSDHPEAGNRKIIFERTILGKAPIVATNPPLATGFMADRVLLYLLRNSPVKRQIVETPEMPGYLYFDAAKMEARAVRGKWW